MIELTLPLVKITKDYKVCWNISSKTNNQVSVRLASDEQEIVAANKQEGNPNHFLISQGFSPVTSEHPLMLEVSCEQADELRFDAYDEPIFDNLGEATGHVYDFCFDDKHDGKFDSIFINVTGWKK